jgi:hypothetical protein
MAITRFPIETDQPIFDVTLPPGRHVLELVVEDSAGLRSGPDTVVITVENILPEITGINPDTARQSTDNIAAVIAGTNLVNIQQINFAGDGITVVDFTESSPEQLQVVLSVAADAALGPQRFTVTTDAGSVQSPEAVTFTVAQGLPQISAIAPASGQQGVSDLTLTISGSYLVDVEQVTFGGGGIEVSDISEVSPQALDITVTIEPDAAVGGRQFTVTTAAGAAESPSGVRFTVLQSAPEITGIEPDNGAQGVKNLPLVIRGASLIGVQRVEFEGDGIEVTGFSESEQTDTELFVVINIGPNAPVGPRSFLVETRGGTARSPARVVFNVTLAEEPTISPTIGPTIRPTLEPTISPTLVPTIQPTLAPTISPTLAPTIRPTLEPTISPTLAPTVSPTLTPTLSPTLSPTFSPTLAPTFAPGPVGPIIFSARDFPGRSVEEVNGIGPTTAERLKKKRITNLAHLASMEPAKLAEILEISEVRAMGFIDEARRLLTEEQ